MTLTINQAPFLRSQRQFPNDDLKALANQMDHSYIDIANKVNSRTIGLFATNFQIVTGESWYLSGQPNKQQTLRQIYTFGAINTTGGSGFTEVDIDHGINMATVTYFTYIYGTANTVVPDVRPFAYSDPNVTGRDLSLIVNPTFIRVIVGNMSPSLTGGIIILEWLSQF